MCETMSDECLAEKFKREFNEQFHILVRMHLSFVLDLNTDENEDKSEKGKLKKWSLNKKFKPKNVIEGAPLTQEGICQVYQLIEFLKKEQNMKIEGIFRRTGSLVRQQELKNLLSQGITVDLEGNAFSVHDCASVLKGFLGELPEPLLTEGYYPAYCQIAELCGMMEKSTHDEKLLTALQLLLLLLPSENKVLLKDILNLLHLTASYESSNRMSPDNLAKLFTPHLLCPRKLTPEQLHINSQNLCGIVSFMIKNVSELFKIPQKLLVDFRAKYEKRKLLSSKCLNESVSDQYAASTVFTFIDQERTAKENQSNTTETALAQLYAHIQSLPESSKKRKLVKQFNKENGHGTPLQVLRSAAPKNKSFGDSIKKHIFHKSLAKSARKMGLVQTGRASSEDNVSTTPVQGAAAKTRLFCNNCDTSPCSEDASGGGDATAAKKTKQQTVSSEDLGASSTSSGGDARRAKSESDLSMIDGNRGNDDDDPPNSYLTSTPACVPFHHLCHDVVFRTPDGQDRSKSMSPITRSTQRMSRAMQETMMTPRSRKPVLLVSGTNINNLAKLENTPMDEVPEETSEAVPQNSSLTDTFREYLSTRSMQTIAVDSSFSSRADDFKSDEFNDVSEKMTDSLRHCLDGNDLEEDADDDDDDDEKQPVLKPKQFDENGQPTVFETSF